MSVADSVETKWHPAACIFPMMSDDELVALSEDIKQHGQREPVIMFEGMILDGRNRWLACKMAMIEPYTTVFTGTKQQALDFVWSLNKERRHLSKSQIAIADAERVILDKRYGNEIKEKKTKASKRQNAGRPSKDNSRELVPVNSENRVDQKRAEDAGTNRKYIKAADEIVNKRPDLADKIKQGELTIPQAKAEIKREQKRQEMAAAVELVGQFEDETPLWTLIQKEDVCDGLQSVVDNFGPARLIFTDPPYNIGVDYGRGADADALEDKDYMRWVKKWLGLCVDCLADDGSLWVMIGDEYAAEYAIVLKSLGLKIRNWIKWYETFGNNCSNRFNRTSRHIFYCVMDDKNFVFNPDAVTRASDRQEKYGDKRAATSGKIWDDVWQIPRLTGTCNERIPDFPTQLPLALVQPIVECASMPGDLVVDPFNGSGTTGVAAVQSKRKYVGIEQLEKNIEVAEMRIRKAQFGGAK